MPRNKEFAGISQKRSALCKKKRYALAPVGINTTPSLKEKSKMGYELLPYEPTFSLPEIEELSFMYKVLKNHNLYSHKSEGYSTHGLFEIDTEVEQVIKKWSENTTVNVQYEYVEEDEKCICVDEQLNHDFPGCLFYTDFTHSNDFETYLAGFALMDELLGVCLWYQFDTDMLIDYLKTEASEPRDGRYDNDDEEADPPVDPDLWGTSERGIYVYGGSQVFQISDVHKSYIKAKEVEADLRIKFTAVWEKMSMEYLIELLEKRTAAAAWLRGVVYLAMNGFHIQHYSLQTAEDNDYNYVPLYTGYAIYNENDDWFSFYDGFEEWQDQESPILRTAYFLNSVVKPNPNINHQQLFTIFNNLFKIDPVKGLFNEDKKHQIRAMLRHLPLHEREWILLRRRIKRAKKGWLGVHKAAERANDPSNG